VLTDACAVCGEPVHYFKGTRIQAWVHDKPLSELKVSVGEREAVLEAAKIRQEQENRDLYVAPSFIGEHIHEAQPRRDHSAKTEEENN
jgi:hypothetical protein